MGYWLFTARNSELFSFLSAFENPLLANVQFHYIIASLDAHFPRATSGRWSGSNGTFCVFLPSSYPVCPAYWVEGAAVSAKPKLPSSQAPPPALYWDDAKAFPGQQRDIIPPKETRVYPGFLPVGHNQNASPVKHPGGIRTKYPNHCR